MIKNADVYYESVRWNDVVRDVGAGGYEYAHTDTENIDQAANKCIDIILKRRYTK